MSVQARRQKEKERRREAILEAAREVFRRKGYEAATMEEIAAEAELSKGTLYLYFGSKAELFASMSRVVLCEVAEGFERIAEQGKSGLETTRTMLHHFVSTASARPKQFRVAVTWLASGEETEIESSGIVAHRESVARVLTLLVAAVERGKADGSILVTTPSPQLAVQLWSGTMGALLIATNSENLQKRSPFTLDPSTHMDSFIALLTNGLTQEQGA